MSKVKIVHLVSNLSIGSGVMGILMNLYRNVNHSIIQFDFVYFDETTSNYKDEIMQLGGSCYKINKPRIGLSFIRDIKKVLKNNEYIALHNHELYLNFIIAPIFKKNNINNVITHSHTTMYSDKKISAIRNRLLCLPIKGQSDFHFACSRAAGEFMYGSSNKYKPIHIINNAIDINKFKYNKEKRDEIRKLLNIENKLVIGHVGRFNEQKNHNFLVEIFNEVINKNKDAVLLLVGDGPLRTQIEKKIKNLGLKNKVLLLGNRTNVNELLQAMDVLVMPSLYEGLPVVGIEAQASGLPCFMSDAITTEVAIANVNLLSLNKSSIEWATEIISFLGSFVRSDTSDVMTKAGFNIKEEAQNIERFYLSLDK